MKPTNLHKRPVKRNPQCKHSQKTATSKWAIFTLFCRLLLYDSLFFLSCSSFQLAEWIDFVFGMMGHIKCIQYRYSVIFGSVVRWANNLRAMPWGVRAHTWALPSIFFQFYCHIVCCVFCVEFPLFSYYWFSLFCGWFTPHLNNT